MTDTNAVIVEYLKASGTALHALVGARVYCPRLPQGFTNSQAVIEVMRRGGSSKMAHAEHRASFQIKCYGGANSHAQAEAVYRALYDRLHSITGMDTASGNIMTAEEENMGQSLFDPETGWPFVLVYFSVTIRPKA